MLSFHLKENKQFNSLRNLLFLLWLNRYLKQIPLKRNI